MSTNESPNSIEEQPLPVLTSSPWSSKTMNAPVEITSRHQEDSKLSSHQEVVQPWSCNRCDDIGMDVNCWSCQHRRRIWGLTIKDPHGPEPGRCTNELGITKAQRCDNFATSWCYTLKDAICHACHIKRQCYCKGKVVNLNWLPCLILLEENDKFMRKSFVHSFQYWEKHRDQYETLLGMDTEQMTKDIAARDQEIESKLDYADYKFRMWQKGMDRTRQ